MIGLATFVKGALSLLKEHWNLVLIALAFAALSAWTYYQGKDAGYRSRNKEVTALNKQIELRDKEKADMIRAHNEKVESLEADSRKSKDAILDLANKLAAKKTEVINQYIDRFPQVAIKCGWSAPTVDAMRALLSVDPKEK